MLVCDFRCERARVESRRQCCGRVGAARSCRLPSIVASMNSRPARGGEACAHSARLLSRARSPLCSQVIHRKALPSQRAQAMRLLLEHWLSGADEIGFRRNTMCVIVFIGIFHREHGVSLLGHPRMTDLNDLKVFERVAALASFSAAGRVLGVPKSTVSRCIARLESQLGVRLLQRTTHSVRLTESGIAFKKRCTEILAHVSDAVDHVTSMGRTPKGALKISAAIGFSYFVLSETLPTFLARYPSIEVSLELTSRTVDIVAEGIDVAVRIGQLPDSRLMTTGLGTIQRYLCATPLYLARRASPQSIMELNDHETIEVPSANGTATSWAFHNNAGDRQQINVSPRLVVNDLGMIYRLVMNNAGIACLPRCLATPDIDAGRLVRLFPEWALPADQVSVVYPTNRGLSPAVRAFVEHMKQTAASRRLWLDDPFEGVAGSPPSPRLPRRRSASSLSN